MLFAERSKNLPHLTDYLTYAASKKSLPTMPDDIGMTVASAAASGLTVGALTFAATGFHSILAGMVAAIGGFAISAAGSIRFNKLANKERPLEDEIRLERDSKAVIMRLHMSMHKKRLHRDLSPDVASVLEEAATQWARARAALESPYWLRGDLSPHLEQVRENSSKAVERSMQELLTLFATAVPESPGSWNLAEVVDEVVGKSVFSSPPQHRFTPFHDDAIRIVEQLSLLADESERLSRQLVSDPSMIGESRPGSRLEATLAELRQMRIAEEELREDMRH